MNKGKVELIKYNKVKEAQFFEYSVEQNNGSTSVEQSLIISSVEGLLDPNWIAEIKLDEFPPQNTPEAAAHKLADWLERLSDTIRSGEYQSFPKAAFKDLSDSETN